MCKKQQLVNTLEQLNNISQLRNLWLRSPDERLASWRKFRIDLQAYYSACDDNVQLSLEAINSWWEQAPIVNVAMDPFNSDSWPTVWEIIYDGECCKYSRGLAMAYNMHYMDNKVLVVLDRVYDKANNDEYMTATFDGKYTLNSQYGKIVNLHNIDSIQIRESWNIQDYLPHIQY